MAEGSETDAEALRRLEERLDRAAAAAERLLGDAMAAGGGSGGGGGGEDDGPPHVPPAGWQQPSSGGGESGRGWQSGELELLLGVLATLRDRIPSELQQRLGEAVREVLLAVRALIDWYLERSERERAEPRQVQDIPIL
jgi:hypothetical protein